MEAGIPGSNDLAECVAVGVFILAVGSEAHDFAFVAVFVVADELADHGVDAAEGVRQEYAFEHFDVVAFAARHHGGDEISGTVVAEAGGFLPGRTVVGAGDVCDVVLEMVLAEPKLRGVDFERCGQQRANVTHRLFALAETDEIQNLRWVGESVLDFLREIRVAILADSDVVNIRNLCAYGVETRLDSKRGETAEVLVAIEALFGDGEDHFTVMHDRRRGVGMKHV